MPKSLLRRSVWGVAFFYFNRRIQIVVQVVEFYGCQDVRRGAALPRVLSPVQKLSWKNRNIFLVLMSLSPCRPPLRELSLVSRAALELRTSEGCNKRVSITALVTSSLQQKILYTSTLKEINENKPKGVNFEKYFNCFLSCPGQKSPNNNPLELDFHGGHLFSW